MKRKIGALGVVFLLQLIGRSPAAEWFVATNGSDAAVGTNWATAKQTIQAGIDAAEAGDTVWVSNGIYATGGGRAVAGTWPNRVAIDRPIRVQSLSGPEETVIMGGGMRCAYVTNGAVLSGFMLTNGTTASGDCDMLTPQNVDHNGGGALGEDNGVLTNCVLTGNYACYKGGGSEGGRLYHCVLSNNVTWGYGGGASDGVLEHCALVANNARWAVGGGARGCTLNDCTLTGNTADYGGGASLSTLNRCLIQDNVGGSEGGGVFWGGTLNQCVVSGNRSLEGGGAARDTVLNDCLVVSNTATSDAQGMRGGGGARQCRLNNCTVVGNSAAGEGGGIFLSVASNCIVFGNSGPMGSNYLESTFGYGCTIPDPGGTGNVTNDPQFVDAAAGDYRLSAGSPCINAGDNAAVSSAADLDGHPRIVNATVDMGAFEYQTAGGTILMAYPASTNVEDGAASGLALGVMANVVWTAATNVPWLAITSGESGTTNGTVVFDVAANTDAGPRTGAVIVAGGGLSRTCTVIQAAFVPALAVSPASTNMGNGIATGRVIEVTANVAWTAATNAPWLAITSGESGTTNGTVLFDVAANAGAARTGAVIVAGGGLSRTCTVVQAVLVPALALSPASTNVGTGGASGLALGVTANVAWTAATNAPWLAITSGESGTTNGTVLFDVAANGGAARTGAVIVASVGLSRTCTVIQAAFVPALAVSPASTNVGNGIATGRVIEVTANVAWTAATNAPWVAITSGESGTTNGTVIFDVAANAGAARTGAVIVAGGGLSRTCRVVQAAFVPALAVSPASTNAGSGGASGLALGVTANVAWTAATNVPWLAITSGESGTTNGTVIFGVAANAGAARTGTIMVAGGGLARTCRVVQAAFVPVLAVSPASTNAGSGGASGLALGVTANVAWTAATNAPWLAITSGDSGTTNGTVLFDVAANAGAARTGAVIVAGGGLSRTCRVVQVRSPAFAANWHVATNGNNAAAGTNWATAKQTIQAAVDAAEAGDVVWVSNGVYDTGGRVLARVTNRVAIDKSLTVQSINGPDETILRGYVATRCVYVGTHALLSGFTLTNGSVQSSGGGAWCESSGTLSNCVLSGNSAGSYGGGAYGGVLRNCTLKGNSASWGGGAHGATLWSCEVSGNSVTIGGSGGGVDSCTANLCVLSGNTADLSGGGGANESTLNNCIVADNLALIGGGTCAGTANNCVVIRNWAGSGFPDDGTGGGGCANGTLVNCIVYGNGATSGSNYLGSAFQHSCTAPDPGGTGNITNDPQFVDAAAGNYRLAAGSPCINAGDNAAAPGATDLDGSPRIVFGTVDMGAYEFLYQHVAPGGSDGADGISWATAKQTIQAAVDAATNGCTVWVSNGTYATGGRIVCMDGGLPSSSNRVAIEKPLTVRSVNGADVTLIQGEKDPASTNGFGDAAVRCAFVETGAVLSGFTLTNGATATNGASAFRTYGGGVVGRGIVENCTLVGNSAWANGGGAYYSALTLNNCKVIGNFAGEYGGGVHSATLNNCTVAGNSAGGAGGGCYQATLRNCIAFSNTAIYGSNYEYCTVRTSCTTPYPDWPGNIAMDPQFVNAGAGNYRLRATSPCLDAGDDGVVTWAEDLDGNPRIAFGAVDMGAYEAQLTGAGTWFGAILNGQTGDLDCAAGDGVPNLLKYATGGSPRISDDNVLLGCPPYGAKPALTFHRNPSATDVRYVVEGADRLTNGAAWRGVATNVGGSWLGATNVEESGAGNPVECTVTDPVALDSNRFLRLRVSRP